MSYDYNALVETIAVNRRKSAEDPATHLQQAVDSFATLSSHCPMTPLLWMQYASDTSKLMQLLLADEPEQATEMQLQTLELAISEFPGCAILRLHYLQLLMESKGSVDKLDAAFQDALDSVGNGSHRNEGELVASIYRLYATHLASHKKPVMDLFVKRARTPMKDANDGLADEVSQFCQSHKIPVTAENLQQLDEGRRWAAKTFDSLAVYEDDIDVAMHAEGILARHEYPPGNDMDWTALLRSESGRLWMGLGGAQTAKAFVRYAQACARYTPPQYQNKEDQENAKRQEQEIQSLALSVYERGVSECPTVESLWLSYIRHLMYLMSTGHPLASVSRLESVLSRAVRNCPYSLQLFQQRIMASLVVAQAGHAVLDPDSLMAIVKEAIGTKFLPAASSHLELFMTAIRAVKRRILSILTTPNEKYDESEPSGKKSMESGGLSDAADEELQDLVEDLRDMYDAAEAHLRDNHKSWSEGRTVVWKDRAMTEMYLLGPLMTSLDVAGDSEAVEGLKCFEKLVKAHQPPHPDSYAAYIQSIMVQHVSTPGQVLRNLRTARDTYQKALRAIGRPKNKPESTVSQRDRATAMHCLCHDYLEFEQLFGSDESYAQASKTVRKKLESFLPNGTQQKDNAAVVRGGDTVEAERKTPSSESTVRTKRKTSADVSEEPATKKAKPPASEEKDADMENPPASTEEDAHMDTADSPEKNTGAKAETKDPVHKVRIGKLDYPAHPFTVRVTNLAYTTEDMDLVETFRPKCGAVVHAKIVREKHPFHQGKAKSKGWGLVQFEERESVEKALELNDVIGINERLVKVSRSHVPAVGLVPPGMHRVNPKGEGKSSKRNEKKRERKQSHDETKADINSEANDGGNTVEDNQKEKEPKATTGNTGILAFRPRGVAHGSAHHKVKLSLGEDKPKH